jgi:anaerobic ribonucleoside-triphosphate reductase activating protein
VRYTVFLQGCAHNCPGCHNPATHDYAGGVSIDADTIFNEIVSLKYIRGVSFSGGEPLDQAAALVPLMDSLRRRGCNICVYTGYTYEEARANPIFFAALRLTDILVDGRFIREKRILSAAFIGSENQRIIDVQASLMRKEVVLFKPRCIQIA